MTTIDLACALTVGFALTAIAAVDARRMIIDFRLITVLAVAALLWRLAGSGSSVLGETGWSLAAGAAVGFALIAVPIAAAEICGRRWPAGGGDAVLLGAVGLLLGLRGLSWTLVAGAVLAMGHRLCLQRRRGRPFAKGHLPLGPGLCAAALLVFLGLLASGGARAEKLPPAAPADRASPLAAVELPPAPFVLPPDLAERQVAVALPDPVSFERAVAELERASGLAVIIEERPARVSGGGTDLPDPPRIPWIFEGSLQDLLWSVRDRAGYAAELRGDALVLYRHRDAGWPLPSTPATTPTAVIAADPAPSPGLFAALSESWLGRIFGAATEDRGDATESPAPPPAWPEAAAKAPSGDSRPSRRCPPGTAPVAAQPAPDPSVPPAGEVNRPAAPPSPPPPPAWPVRAGDHETLEGVLASWADTAGWTLIWRASRSYALAADAEFRGNFLDAVDQLLADAATRRSLAATAYDANRHLVIEDVEGGR